jgi:hypothetical protein
VEDRIDDGTILRFLRERAGSDFDFSLLLDTGPYRDFEGFYVSCLQDILVAYGGKEYRKWGVKHRGLCLLIGWTTEILQRGTGWRPAADPGLEERDPTPSATGLNG